VTAVDASRPVDFLSCGPEQALHIGDVRGTAAAASGTMHTGPWARGSDGGPCPGVLGVLADVVWGGAAVAGRPAGMWAVTTELSLSFGAPVATDGTRLLATGAVAHLSGDSSFATGTVRTEDGEITASGAVHTRFVAGDASAHVLPAGMHTDADAPGFAEWLGLEFAPDGLSATIPTGEAVSNPGGHLHGGVIFCISELAAAHAVSGLNPDLRSSSLHTVFLRRAELGGRVRCETDIVYRGRTTATATVCCLRPDGKPCAFSTATFGPVAPSNG